MKRIRKSLLIIFILLIGMTFNVKAENFYYYLSNGEQGFEYFDKNGAKAINVKKGDTIFVTSVLDNRDNVSNYQIKSGKLTIRWDDKYLALQEINGKVYNDLISDISGLKIGGVNKNTTKVTLSDISSTGFLKNGKNKIVEFKFVVLETATSGTTKVYQMDGEDSLKCYNSTDDKTIDCGDSLYSEIKYSITKSSVNNLTSIKIDGSDIDGFKEDVNTYSIIVNPTVTKIRIDATKKDIKSTISGDIGEKQLEYGVNNFTIIVTSESGVKNTYMLTVTRTDTRSSVNTLKTLTISEGEFIFDPNITEYTINVLNEVDKVTITSSLTDPKSKYVVDYQNKDVLLNEGSNKIDITVVSEKGEEKTYTLNINRALSSNNSLKTLKVNDEKIALIENEFTYKITVDNDVDQVTITAIPNDSKATVKLDESYPLIVGENEIIVSVVAADGGEALYTLTVTRNKILSADSLLVSLIIEGYNIDFKPDEKLYNLRIKDNESELNISTVPKDPNATVEIEGNKELENGSIVKINVKAEDGSFTRYFINIEKGSSSISPIIFVIISLFLLLGGCIALIVYRRKKNAKKELETSDLDKNNQEQIVDKKEETKKLDDEANDNYVGTHIKEDTKEIATLKSKEVDSDDASEPPAESDYSESKEENDYEEDNNELPNDIEESSSEESKEVNSDDYSDKEKESDNNESSSETMKEEANDYNDDDNELSSDNHEEPKEKDVE